MRWPAVAAFTRVRAPGDVAAAARTCFTGVQDLPSAKSMLNTSFSLYGAAFAAGQAEGKPPFIELHNPTDKEIITIVHSPAHAPLFGGMSIPVRLPPGDSLRLKVRPRPATAR